MIKSNTIFFVFIISALFSIAGGCQNDKDGQPDTNQFFSKQNKQIKFTDSIEVKTIYFNDNSQTQTQYRNGVRNGWTKNFDPDGNLTAEATYVNDKLEGEFRSYYPDGKIMMKAYYKNGLLDGITYLYFPDGQVQKETKYERNKIIFIKEYDKNGKLLYEDKF